MKFLKYQFLVLTAVWGGVSFGQAPDLYKSLPSYPPKPEIIRNESGPRPNSVVPDSASANPTFIMTEYHPPKLRMLVRTPCGERVNRQELIDKAKREVRSSLAVTVNQGNFGNGDRVSLWAVVSVKKWSRRVSLQASDGKYVMRNNRTEEDYEWRVEQVYSGGNGSGCINEANLDKQELWEIISSALMKVWVDNKNKNSI